MKLKVFSLVAFLFLIFEVQAVNPKQTLAFNLKSNHINIDSLLKASLSDTISKQKISQKRHRSGLKQLLKTRRFQSVDTPKVLKTQIHSADTVIHFTLPTEIKPVKVDSLLLKANPFFIELVYRGMPSTEIFNPKTDFKALFYGQKLNTPVYKNQPDSINHLSEKIIDDLRNDARDNITQTAVKLYVMNYDELPDPEGNRSRYIVRKPLSNVQFVDQNEGKRFNRRKIEIKNPQLGPWQYKASSMAQFSESSISSNWYQGGYSNLAVLGILSGQLTYDDKKCIQWDNCAEWRLGFNSVAGDTIHWLSTNDDVVRINSKLGVKAGGNFFYSGSVDFSTQFFNSYNGVNSTKLKASFLAPVRLNIGVGLDYKYKKIFSLMLSPFSYKYIYVNAKTGIDPNLFGVKSGEIVLSEIGSSIKAIYSYPITHEIQLDSKLSFYTNYKKVEIDWEVVCNMYINRFLSTRLSFNPRYDNTVIEKNGTLARMQLKQLLSVGFAHKFY